MQKNKLGKTSTELKKEMNQYIKQSAKRLKEKLRTEWQKEKTTKKVFYV